MRTIHLIVGDWPDDGHGRTVGVVIKSNLSTVALKKAYKAGVKATGIDLSRIDRTLVTKALWDDFTKFGLTLEQLAKGSDVELDEAIESLNDPDERWRGFEVGPSGYAYLWCFIAKQGNGTFDWSMVTPKTIDIGGYGILQERGI